MMMKPPSQQATTGRKTVMAGTGIPSAGSSNGVLSPGLRQDRHGGGGRGRGTIKTPLQTPVFEGVYNNSRMLHFLTAVVGSACDVRVKNGNVFQGIFKTLSSKFELAVDAVHKKTADLSVGPRQEEIVDTMIFKPMDIVLLHFRNVDFNYATKDKFTDSAIAMNSKVNGEHKEKVLMRWDGGENSDDYDLDSDVSNGWDPNEMFRYNEENYGVKTTYDSSLSSYTVPLEKDNSDEFRQREARAAQLAREIEASPQYRQRIAIENDDGRTEEEKHSSVQRQNSERDSPNLGCREGKYTPLPQRVRDGPRGGLRTSMTRGGRPGVGAPPLRVTTNHPEASLNSAPEQRVVNGGSSRMSPKAQRPVPGTKAISSPSSRPVEISPAPASGRAVYPPRSPKLSTPSVSSQDSPVGSSLTSERSSPPESRTSLECCASLNPSSPNIVTPAAPSDVDGKDVLVCATNEEGLIVEVAVPSELMKTPCKGLQIDQKRNQLEELRKFGADFRLHSSSASEADIQTFVPKVQDSMEIKVQPADSTRCEAVVEPEHAEVQSSSASIEIISIPKEDKGMCQESECLTQTSSPPRKAESEIKDDEPPMDSVKKFTLNPNAKEFNPSKPLLTVNKATSTPTSPGPRSHSATIPVLPTGQGAMYSPYISYLPPLHMSQAVQAPQMYQYPVSNSVPGQQGKYRGTKGPLPPQRAEQHQPNSAPPILQAAAAAGPPLVAATPYSSYIYNPQQFTGQPTLMQPMAHYSSQPVFAPMLQNNPRILSGSHPQAMVSPTAPQYPPTDQPAPQALYATVHQSYPHHAAQLHPHQPQPATTPNGGQQQGQHTAPSPVQHQGSQPQHLSNAPPQQNLYHTATLTATPPSLTPGPPAQSPQSSYPQQAVYAIHAHQQLQHSYSNIAHMAQAHVQSGLSGAPPTHPGAPHPTQVMLLHPSQTHGGPSQAQQSGVPSISASNPSPYTYLGHHQVQSHPPQQLPYHPPGN
ncbi:ataxin-2-like protein isoform X1 [Pleurodeles waltl]|uniref:ataxin-2-like protein isoform X1 n=1 Tax=Pleurodeles waltl TaxID=8319 RepID=UPI0037093F8A